LIDIKSLAKGFCDQAQARRGFVFAIALK